MASDDDSTIWVEHFSPGSTRRALNQISVPRYSPAYAGRP